MGFIFGLPQLHLVQHAIDWNLFSILWDYHANIVEIYRCGGGVNNSYDCTSPLPLVPIIIRENSFHDLAWEDYAGGVWAGLLQALLNSLYIYNAKLSPMCTAAIFNYSSPNKGTNAGAFGDTGEGAAAEKQK